MAASLAVKVKKTGRVRPPQLDNGQLTYIGRLMVAAQKDRWSKSIDAEGNQAKPLSMRYFFKKRKYLGVNQPRRDNRLTGLMAQNFQLRKAINGVIRAEPTSRMARQHANQAQGFEEMIGFAGSDQTVVFRAAQREYGAWLQKAWVPIG